MLFRSTMSQLRGTLDEAYVIDKPAGSDDGSGTGRYSLTFKDMGGNVLFTRHFDSYSPDTDQPLSFSQMVPYDPRIASIVLSSNTVPLATRTRSPNAPAIQILTPQAGVHWDGARHVTWQASDADGDPLHYAVQYSSDGGSTWLTLATGLKRPSFDVDAATLQGSRDCRIRVIASDGLNSTTAESGQFGVNPHAPSARIISAHVDGHTGAVTLVGSGYDADDGPLPDARLSWRASRDGQLGTGPTLVTRPLSSGRHVITLTVVDRDGNRASATLVVRLRRNPVPSAPRRLRSRVRRGRVHLRWHRAHGARTYVVQSASLHGVPRFVTIAMLGRRARSFTVGAGGNHHRYRVEACNRAGCTPSTPLTAGR